MGCAQPDDIGRPEFEYELAYNNSILPIYNVVYGWDSNYSGWEPVKVNYNSPNLTPRVTTIDFYGSDLNHYTPEDIIFYNQFRCVYAIRTCNFHLKRELFEALKTFPKLKYIVVHPGAGGRLSDDDQSDKIDLEKYEGKRFNISFIESWRPSGIKHLKNGSAVPDTNQR